MKTVSGVGISYKFYRELPRFGINYFDRERVPLPPPPKKKSITFSVEFVVSLSLEI